MKKARIINNDKMTRNLDDDVHNLAQNRIAIEDYIEWIKRGAKTSQNVFYITLFVLKIAQLEATLKGILKFLGKNYDDQALGTIVCGSRPNKLGKIEKPGFFVEIKIFNKSITKYDHYTEKTHFSDDYLKSFKDKCIEIKNLRNDLYHNLFITKDANFPDILQKIKNITESNDVVYEDCPVSEELEKITNRRNLVNDKDKFPKDWTLEKLVEISKKYFRIILKYHHAK